MALNQLIQTQSIPYPTAVMSAQELSNNRIKLATALAAAPALGAQLIDNSILISAQQKLAAYDTEINSHISIPGAGNTDNLQAALDVSSTVGSNSTLPSLTTNKNSTLSSVETPINNRNDNYIKAGLIGVGLLIVLVIVVHVTRKRK